MHSHHPERPETLMFTLGRLHDLGMDCATSGREHSLLDGLLEEALRHMDERAGCVHVVSAEDGQLHLAGHRGLNPQLLELCETERDGTVVFGVRLEAGGRLTLDDDRGRSDCPTAARRAILAADALALQLTPLRATNGGILAVLSIFLSTSRQPTDAQLQLIDLCCRQAANFLELDRSRKTKHHRRVQGHNRPGQFRRRDEQALATLAHEIRQPVAAALQAVELGKLTDRAEEQEQASGIIERQLRHIARLVDELSTPSRGIESALSAVRRESLDLREPLEEALQTASALFETKGHELTVDLPATPAMVSADATRMKQLFTNLLQNAASYTPDGGRIAVSLVEEGDLVGVRVRDNGIGIQPEALGQIFEAFARSSADGDSSHLGVGLAIVRQIAEAHGGTAVAHSDGEGAGSEFVISLPAARGDGEFAQAESRHGILFEETAEHPGDIRHDRLILRPKRPAGEPARVE